MSSEREILTWELFGTASRELAQMVADDGYEPDMVLSIARGGLLIGGAMGYALSVKNTYTMNVEFYTGVDERLEVPRILPPAPNGTPTEEDFIPGTIVDCAVGEIVWSTVVAFDRTKFPNNRPWTIRDFFDVEKFPGKRGLRKTPRVNLEWALMADGVPTRQVYEVLATEEGVDRAFRKLDVLKPHTVWWEAGAQPPQLLADGEVVMTSAYNGRLYNAMVKEKKPFVIIWDGQVWDIDLWGIVKGTPSLATALEFVIFSTDTVQLANQAKYISYGPVRRSSMDLVDPKVKPHLPTSPDNFSNSLQNDFEWWADNQQDMDERFTTWLTR